jgi:5-oxopent-3-ene-1,2,5-tricarboxylate decarboxylase/2-hydroxyhepta-2,4-diene-1,7-dioate isomerase
MRHARVSLAGTDVPVRAAVTADGAGIDLVGRVVPLEAARLAPAISGWIYGPLLNEQSSWDRFGAQLTADPYKAPPAAPALYFKPPNTHLAHGGVVRLPAYAEAVELGASIGMVMGRAIGRASPETALDAVAGYTIVLDLSVPSPSIYRPPVQEKCFDTACPVGPWVVDRADIADPAALVIETHVNDRLVATRGLGDLVRGPGQLLADVTEFMTLSAGDVLTLGHPVGAVPTAGRGDRIRITVAGIGSLDCTISEEPA